MNALIVYCVILTILCLVLCVTGIAQHFIYHRHQKKFFRNMYEAMMRHTDEDEEDD